jgi:hypothetical protein
MLIARRNTGVDGATHIVIVHYCRTLVNACRQLPGAWTAMLNHSEIRKWVPIRARYEITRRTRCGIGRIRPVKISEEGTLSKIPGSGIVKVFRYAAKCFETGRPSRQ